MELRVSVASGNALGTEMPDLRAPNGAKDRDQLPAQPPPLPLAAGLSPALGCRCALILPRCWLLALSSASLGLVFQALATCPALPSGEGTLSVLLEMLPQAALTEPGPSPFHSCFSLLFFLLFHSSFIFFPFPQASHHRLLQTFPCKLFSHSHCPIPTFCSCFLVSGL